MPVTSCPHCQRQGNLPAVFVGKQVKCRGCGRPFIAAEAIALDEGDMVPEAAGWDSTVDAAFADESPPSARCPYCKEQIQSGALKCKHCGEYLSESLREDHTPKPNPGIAA